MTNMRGGQEDMTVMEILDQRLLQPTVGDVTLSGVIREDDEILKK